MDFRGRLNQSSSRPTEPAVGQHGQSHDSFGTQPGSGFSGKPKSMFRWGSVILLFAISALVIALTFLVAFSGNAQKRAVSKEKYQAVFLNNGQVYFGKIARINNSAIDLRGIYYLQTNGDGSTQQTSSNSNISLVKLGCELHAPYDQMLINSEQVLFWENIQDNSQVVKAINEYKKQNGSKINCSQSSSNSTQQAPSSSSNTNGTGTSTGTSTGTTSTPAGGTTGTTGTSGTGGTTTTPKKP